jgi:glycosyltransferase involved in cell wall biosynthesis
MLVWLASYPRSGNHLLRMILQRSFDLGSYEIYQAGARPLQPEEAEIVGVRQFGETQADEFLASARAAPELFLVKTHDRISAEDRAIYVVRDGRAAIASYERYLRDIDGRSANVESIIAGRVRYGAWQEHVRSYLARDPANTLVLRFEDLASDAPPLDRIATFLRRPVVRKFDVPFSRLHEIAPLKYANGSNAWGAAHVERHWHRPFWRAAGKTMRDLGYGDDGPRDPGKFKRKTFFLHLPKSAGTSIWAVLRELAGNERVFQVSSTEQRLRFLSMSQQERDGFDVVGGHFPLDFYRGMLNLGSYFRITTIREPISRLQSEYFYAAQNPKHSGHAAISQMSFLEFVADRSNEITGLLAGRADAQAALNVLQQDFDRWVLTEDINILNFELRRRAGKPLRAVPHINIGPRSGAWPSLSQEEMRVIERNHGADLELHRKLVELKQRPERTSVSLAGETSEQSSPITILIATPTFNVAPYLEEALQSVVTQEGDFTIRYHIQDGGSSDDTLAIARRWQARIAGGEIALRCKGIELSIDSSPDVGMYDALNRAFARLDLPARALMTWINGDDRLAAGALKAVVQAFADLPQVALLGGRTAIINAEGRSLGGGPLVVHSRRAVAAGLHDGRYLPMIMQEGTFWRRELWQTVGGLDASFRLAGDWDLWRRFAGESQYTTLDTITGFHRRRPGQLTQDISPYRDEIDHWLAREHNQGRYSTTLKDYTQAWSEGSDRLRETFPASIARRGDDGRWMLMTETPPAPQHRDLFEVDGDWIPASGFGDREGPFPEMGIPGAFHWTTSSPATIKVFSSRKGRRRLTVSLRGMVLGQQIRMELPGGRTVRHWMIGRPRFAQSIRIEHDFDEGPNTVLFEIQRPLRTGDGRTLGVMLTGVMLSDAPPRTLG